MSVVEQVFYPFSCLLCKYVIESDEDAAWWHGWGNCVDVPDDIRLELEVEPCRR